MQSRRITAIRSSPKLSWTKSSQEWDKCRLSTTRDLSWMLRQVSPSEDTPFQQSKRSQLRLQEDMNHWLSAWFTFCWLVISQTNNSLMTWARNWRAMATWPRRKLSSSPRFPRILIQWLCSPWLLWISKEKASSSSNTIRVWKRLITGHTTMMTQWPSFKKYHSWQPLSTVTNTRMEPPFQLMIIWTGLETILICLAMTHTKWRNASEDIWQFMLIMREVMCQHTLPILLDLPWLILISHTLQLLMDLLDHYMDLLINNVWNGCWSSRYNLEKM